MSDHEELHGTQKQYREVTLAAILFALIIGLVMNAAITYAGLKIGFTLGGSAIAAVLGFGVLRGLLRKGSILETNIAQTAASAVNTSNSGIIFTVPVLLLLGYSLTWSSLDFWLITLACVAGAILGAAFIIPLRKQMIDIDRLRFPTGTGVAVILKSPGAGAKKSIVLLAGIALGAVIYLPSGLPQITSPADTQSLQQLFEEERISYQQVINTQTYASWIEQEQADPIVFELGKLAHDAEIFRRQRLDAYESLKAPGTTESDRTEYERIDALLSETRQALESAPRPEGYRVSDALALAAYRAQSGELTPSGESVSWADLRDTSLGWAQDPLPGYQDLQFRLNPIADSELQPIDQNGDGVPDPILPFSTDQDGNGNPDLVVTDSTIDLGRMLGIPTQFQIIFAIAPFAIGAGFITGRAGLLVLAGGILAFFVLTPAAYELGWLPGSLQPHEAPGYAFGAFNRPLGIGLLLGGALMGVIASFPAIAAALKSVASAGKAASVSAIKPDELSLRPLLVAVAGALVLLFLAADITGSKPINDTCPITQQQVTNFEPGDARDLDERPTRDFKGYALLFADSAAAESWDAQADDLKLAYLSANNASPGLLASLPTHVRALLIAIVGGLWIWFAGIIIAQCTGMTDWSPISGMALLTVVLVMLLAGSGAVVGAVLIGAALCVAITLAADMMADLKTGHLLGASPRRQQTVELFVVGIGPAVAMLVLLIIASANLKATGVAMGPGTPTPAPQAQALQAVITGVQGGELPYALYGFGALLGALLGLGAFSGLGVLVGLSMYLPFAYIATYGIGCLINIAVTKMKGRAWAEDWGVPFAAGLVVGESVLALLINLIVLAN